MSEASPAKILPYTKGVDIPSDNVDSTWNFILERGSVFADTAFVRGGEFGDRDIKVLKGYYQEVFDYQKQTLGADGAVFNKSLQRHLLLAERIAKTGAEKLEIDSHLLRAVLLMHDFGRMFSHRRGRNDAIERTLFNKFNFSEEFTSLFPVDPLWTQIGETRSDKLLKQMTEKSGGITAAVVLFDVLAKWKDEEGGPLRRWEDVIPRSQQNQKIPDKESMWPSEYIRQKKIVDRAGLDTFAYKYKYIKDWFEQKTGESIDDFVGEVEKSLVTQPLDNNWTN